MSSGLILGLGLCTGGLPAVALADGLTPNVYHCDASLANNKRLIIQAVRDVGGSQNDTLLALAMAMQETVHCCPTERDCSKDCTPSANYSCFNMNYDMLAMLGWHGKPDLNDQANLRDAVCYLVSAWRLWGVDSTLNFHRGGRQAWQDGTSFGAEEYRNAIKATVEYLRQHSDALTDNTRVSFNLGHV